MPSAPLRFGCALLAWLIAVPAAVARQDDGGGDRPDAARRIVRVFDFEERPMNPEPVPMHWFRAQHDPPTRSRPGFPAWNRAAFDNSTQTSGQWSVRLPTEGGSVSLRLSSGVIPAMPGADYEIAANVRTADVQHAAARISARLLDDRRRVIEGTERSSPLSQTGGQWQRTAVELRGDYPHAAWLQIDLELVQPRERSESLPTPIGVDRRLAGDPIERERVLLEDVAGAAWFDDVVVRQVPRISLRVGGGAGIVLGPGAPEFRAQVRDLTGERLMATMRLTGVDGDEIARIRFEAPAGQEEFVWRPALSDYGWGRATMEVLNDDGPIGSATADFAWLPPLPAPPRGARDAASGFAERERFVVFAEGADPARLGFLGDALRATGAGATQVSAWTANLRKPEVRALVRALDKLMESVGGAGAGVSLALSAVPHELGQALKIDSDASPFDALFPNIAPAEPTPAAGERPAGQPASSEPTADLENAWRAYLNDTLSKFGQRVRRWQIGASGSSLAFWRPTLREDLSAAEATFARLVPKPIVTLPWAPEHEADSRVGPDRALTISVAWDSPAAVVGEVVAKALSGARAGADNTILIEPPPRDAYAPRAMAIELVKRAALAWERQPARLGVRAPWTLTDSGADPDVNLCVWRQLVERLGGRRVAGELPVAEGARCLILDGPNGGALLGWNDWAKPENAAIEMYLGDKPVFAVDPFGNAEPVPLTNRVHRVALTETPVFIEGINVELARFRAGFAIEPGSLPSEAALHTAEIVLNNPWPVAISGAMRIVEPSKWKIEPRVFSFDIPSGGSQRLPVDISFGVSEESGVRRLVAEADINADSRYSRVRLAAPVEIGGGTTQLTPSYAFVPDASGAINDVAITLSVTNNGDAAASMRVFALAPGFPRHEAAISLLEPGQSAVRRFILPGGVRTLMGQRLRVGLVQVGGVERLNQALVIQ